jgi:hypothetical protein
LQVFVGTYGGFLVVAVNFAVERFWDDRLRENWRGGTLADDRLLKHSHLFPSKSIIWWNCLLGNAIVVMGFSLKRTLYSFRHVVPSTIDL